MNYFDENKVRPWVEEYLKLPIETRKTTEPGKTLRNNITKEISNIVRAIIFTHRFIRFDDYDDLYQNAMEACIKSLEKFDPTYVSKTTKKLATVFDYFSLTAKRCLIFITIRDQSRRNNLELKENLYKSNNRYSDSNEFEIDSIVQCLQKIKISPKYKKINNLLILYLKYGKTFNKREFFKFARCFGWTVTYTRNYYIELQSYKEVFMEGISDESSDIIIEKENIYE